MMTRCATGRWHGSRNGRSEPQKRRSRTGRHACALQAGFGPMPDSGVPCGRGHYRRQGYAARPVVERRSQLPTKAGVTMKEWRAAQRKATRINRKKAAQTTATCPSRGGFFIGQMAMITMTKSSRSALITVNPRVRRIGLAFAGGSAQPAWESVVHPAISPTDLSEMQFRRATSPRERIGQRPPP